MPRFNRVTRKPQARKTYESNARFGTNGCLVPDAKNGGTWR